MYSKPNTLDRRNIVNVNAATVVNCGDWTNKQAAETKAQCCILFGMSRANLPDQDRSRYGHRFTDQDWQF